MYGCLYDPSPREIGLLPNDANTFKHSLNVLLEYLNKCWHLESYDKPHRHFVFHFGCLLVDFIRICVIFLDPDRWRGACIVTEKGCKWQWLQMKCFLKTLWICVKIFNNLFNFSISLIIYLNQLTKITAINTVRQTALNRFIRLMLIYIYLNPIKSTFCIRKIRSTHVMCVLFHMLNVTTRRANITARQTIGWFCKYFAKAHMVERWCAYVRWTHPPLSIYVWCYFN